MSEPDIKWGNVKWLTDAPQETPAKPESDIKWGNVKWLTDDTAPKQTGEVPSEPAESYPTPAPAAPEPTPVKDAARRAGPVAEATYNVLTDPLSPVRGAARAVVDPAWEALFGTRPSEQTWKSFIPDVPTVAAIPGEVLGAAGRGAKQVATALGMSPALQRDIAGMVETEMGGVGPGLTEAARALKAGAGVAVPLARSVPQIEAAGQAVAGTAGAAGRAATAPVRWVWDKGAQNVRALRGAETERTAQELADAVKSGKFGKLLDPKLNATEAQIESLVTQGKVSRQEAANAIRQVRSNASPEVLRAQRGLDAVTEHVGQLHRAIEESPLVSQTGENMLGTIKANRDALQNVLKEQGRVDFDGARALMDAKFETGDIFQQTPWMENMVEKLKSTVNSEKWTTASPEDKSFVLNRLIPQLRGEESAGGVKFTHPNRLLEINRELKDAAKGRPATGYDAIGQQRAGDLSGIVSEALESWTPELSDANARYTANLENLIHTRTGRGAKVFRTEPVNYEQLKIDPKEIPNTFFKSPQGVAQLTELANGDVAAVEKFATDYAFRKLAHKSPAEMQTWLHDNEEWLNSRTLPGAYDRVRGTVGQIVRGEEHAKTLADELASRQQTTKELSKTILSQAKKTSAEFAKEEQALRNSLVTLREPFDRLQFDLEQGNVKPQNLSKEIRGILDKNSEFMWPGEIKAWNTRLDEIDKIRDAETKRREALKLFGKRVAGGATAGLGGWAGYKTLRGLWGRD